MPDRLQLFQEICIRKGKFHLRNLRRRGNTGQSVLRELRLTQGESTLFAAYFKRWWHTRFRRLWCRSTKHAIGIITTNNMYYRKITCSKSSTHHVALYHQLRPDSPASCHQNEGFHRVMLARTGLFWETGQCGKWVFRYAKWGKKWSGFNWYSLGGWPDVTLAPLSHTRSPMQVVVLRTF